MATGNSANVCILDNKLEACYPPNPSTTRGAGIQVYAHPREPRIIYASGKYVVVRNLENPADNFVYRGHQFPVTVAKFSPNGYWVASGDASGKVRVWSWDHPEHILKIEVPVFAGEIKDLDWDGESKKIVAVGDGSGQLAKVFVWDTGNSVGEMVGHNKRVISVSYRQQRPFRIFTASEDMSTLFYAGPPFRMDHSNRSHTNFVNCVRFSPDGTHAVSVGADKKIQLYDGKTGEPTREILDAHAGSIYSVAWNPEGTKFLTASADKTVKLWDVDSASCETTFTFSEDAQVGDFQVAVLWTATHMLSVSLNGNINFLDLASPNAPSRIIQSHQVGITSLIKHPDNPTFITGSFDGVVCNWENGVARRYIGPDKRSVNAALHNGKVSGITIAGGNMLSVGWDDTARVSPVDAAAVTDSFPLNGQPVAVASSPHHDVSVVVTLNAIHLFNGPSLAGELSGLSYTPSAVAVLRNEEVAVGGTDNKIYIYAIQGNTLSQTAVVTGHLGTVTALAYSPNGELLGAGDSTRAVNVWQRGAWTAVVQGTWVYHTTRVNCLAWSPSGQFLASGSVDEQIIVWNIDTPRQKGLTLSFAHKEGVTGVAFLDEDRLVSAGNDHCVCVWNLAAGDRK